MGTILYLVGLVYAVLAVLDIFKKNISTVGKVIASVLVLLTSWVGLLVINALLILPGAAARNIARNMRQYTLFALVGAVVSGVAGLLISFYAGSSTGASITLCLALFFGATFCLRRQG